jgi:DNA polymerase
MPVPGSSPDRSIKAIAGMDWTAIEAGVAACSACGLCRSRHRTVFGAGNPRASLMIIGEAPGADEDASGVPFVGQAGKLLDSMLASLGLVRERDVYIANVLKCRPPANRDPQPDEVARCAPWLERQIELVSPRLILAMGRLAAQTLLATESSIAGLRGRTHVSRDRPVLVSYHPAWLLRTPADKARAWEDLLQVREALGSAPGDSPGMSTD